MRRCKGIWPPSKPGRCEYPLRDFCPLLPAPAVLPNFEPMPRPTRTLRWREPRGGFKFERDGFSAILNLNKMVYACDHAANRRRVLNFQDLLHPAEAETANRLTHALRATDEADDPL